MNFQYHGHEYNRVIAELQKWPVAMHYDYYVHQQQQMLTASSYIRHIASYFNMVIDSG